MCTIILWMCDHILFDRKIIHCCYRVTERVIEICAELASCLMLGRRLKLIRILIMLSVCFYSKTKKIGTKFEKCRSDTYYCCITMRVETVSKTSIFIEIAFFFFSNFYLIQTKSNTCSSRVFRLRQGPIRIIFRSFFTNISIFLDG